MGAGVRRWLGTIGASGASEPEVVGALTSDKALRELLIRLLGWEDAHVGFDKAVADIPAGQRGLRPPGGPHSCWQILEHIRIAQHDILDFCVNADYEEMSWPADYWPASPEPPSAAAWNDSIQQYHRDLQALQDLAEDPKIDLAEKIPHGLGQTYLRELLLVADHTAYHVGQLVLVRQLLGAWHA
jgi:uncharacterized damage-inducible protein DinB